MRLVAFVKSLDNPCCRYRLEAFRPYLERAGHSLRVQAWPKSFLSRMLLGRSLRGTDVLILQRKMPPDWQLEMFRTLSQFLVFDFDDAVFLGDSFDPHGPHCPKRSQRFRGVVKAADVVVAGNSFLRDEACLWVEPGRVQTIPTCLDAERYPLARHGGQSPPADLVWIGSASTLRGLQQIRPLLEAIGAGQPGLQFKIICDEFIDLQCMNVIRCPWSKRTEAEELAGAKMGFSWLPDDLWSRGKCGLKVLQYMAAGLPVIANPVGLHRQLVIPGHTGFLVETAAECVAAIRRLHGDPALRQRLGFAGRELVRKQFPVALGAASWIRLLEQLTHATRTPRLAH